jgi:hypothetical protein
MYLALAVPTPIICVISFVRVQEGVSDVGVGCGRWKITSRGGVCGICIVGPRLRANSKVSGFSVWKLVARCLGGGRLAPDSATDAHDRVGRSDAE